jgi:hypothetical protein
VNEIYKGQTLFICFIRYYLSQDNQYLKENYLDFENQILLLYRRGYSAKTEDKAFIKSQDYKSDSRRLKYLLLASYSLKLDDFTFIQALCCHMNLITCLASLKNDLNIGFYNSFDIQITKLTRFRSDYQNEIINYIRNSSEEHYKAYDITQIESNRGLNFKAFHTMIHQVTSWIRTTFSWISDDNLIRYFNEFCFKINRSQRKATIFNNLIVKMVEGDKIYQSELISN